MHKTKDGEVIVSLTEIKNKTGDIFALVDQLGKVVVTSYNKRRYVITKIGIDTVLELKEEEEKSNARKPVKVRAIVEEEVLPEIKEVEEPVEKQQDNEQKEVKLIEHTLNIKDWERDNGNERSLVELSVKPLITN